MSKKSNRIYLEGRNFWKNGEIGKAKDLFYEAIELDAGFPHPYYDLAFILDQQKGNPQKIYEYYSRFIELAKDNPKLEPNVKKAQKRLAEIQNKKNPPTLKNAFPDDGVVVSKAGNGDYKTIKEAIDSSSEYKKKEGRNRLFIWVAIGILIAGATYFLIFSLPNLSDLYITSSNSPQVVNDVPQVAESVPTQRPTEKIIEIPSQVNNLLNGARLIFKDNNIDPSSHSTINAVNRNGILELDSTSGDSAYLVTDTTATYLGENEAFLVKFKISPGGEWEMDIRTDGEGGTENSFAVGFHNEESFFTVEKGEWKDIKWFGNQFEIQDDQWYLAIIAIGPDANFLISIWEEDSLESIIQGYQFEDNFNDLRWVFNSYVEFGIVYIDYIETYTFNSFR